MKTLHVYLPDEDLSETQIYVTRQTYDRFAREYATLKERNPITIREIKKYNIRPFLKYVTPQGTVLIVASEAGRDYNFLTKTGLLCINVGLSYGLLREAIKRVPRGLFAHFDLRSLPFLPQSFDGVYADALTLVPRRDLTTILRDFHVFLNQNGVLYMSVKLGSANVMEINDFGGKRYVALYRKKEVLDVLKKTGFRLLWSATSPDTDRYLPKWFSLVAKKI